jgi:energy-coupling factor transporter ATP-binding protein EcfA2
VVLDEPTTGLDPALRTQVLRFLKAISLDTKTPFLYVSHHWREVSYVCETVCVVERPGNDAATVTMYPAAEVAECPPTVGSFSLVHELSGELFPARVSETSATGVLRGSPLKSANGFIGLPRVGDAKGSLAWTKAGGFWMRTAPIEGEACDAFIYDERGRVMGRGLASIVADDIGITVTIDRIEPGGVGHVDDKRES